ncbi:MAG: hypothetical protein ABMA64_24360 [Myxococcota bacterium]
MDLGEQLRLERTRRELEMSPGDRVCLALQLGARDLRAFASANGLSMREAYRELRRVEQRGRTPSPVLASRDPR